MTTRQATVLHPGFPQTQRASGNPARTVVTPLVCWRAGGTMAPRAAGAAVARGPVAAAGAPREPARNRLGRPQGRLPACGGEWRMATEAEEL